MRTRQTARVLAVLILAALGAPHVAWGQDLLVDEETGEIVHGGQAQEVVEGEYVPPEMQTPAVQPAPMPEPEAVQPAPMPEPGVVEPAPMEEQEMAPELPAPPPGVQVNPPRPRPTRPTPRARPQRAAGAPQLPSPRPAIPAAGSSAPTEKKDGQTIGGPVTFNFQNAELSEVIASIAAATGRNFDVDPNIGATPVTVITHDVIPPEMAYEVLESILSSRGFSMVETLEGRLIKILPTPEAVPSDKTPLRRGTQGVPEEAFDVLSTHIVPIKFADATDLSTILQRLGSKNGRIDVYVPTQTLIITDTADGLRRMFSFLEEVDVPGFETVMEIFALEYTRAEVIQQQLEQVLMDTGSSGGRPAAAAPGQPPMPVRPTRTVRPTVPGAGPSQVIGTREEVLRMVPDERLNALIVMASEGMMEKVRDLVNRLDMPTPYEANNLHIYELLHADAEQVEQALQGITGTAPRAQSGPGGGGGGGGGGGAAMAAASAASPEVQPFEQKIQITRYDQTNSLLVVASPQDYKLLEVFISRLDVPARQVYVDAVIMDVTISDDFGLTVDTGAITGEDGFGMTSTANISQVYAALAGTANTANGIVLGPESGLAAGAALLGLGANGGLTTGVFDEVSFEFNGKKVSIPFVPLLVQAIEKLTDVEVLSQPSLLTVDNEEASIVVGQEVPFVVGTSSPRTSGEGDLISTGFTRVQREEVGVKLKVTPQISEGDYVALLLEIEVSDLDAQQVGTVDILGPTTNKSLVNNRVVVKDGGTAVIAGLIRDNKNRKVTQSPLLGDVPLLGWLFRSKSDTRNKRNMVVLVTPHIVKEGIDLSRVTQYKVEEYRDANVDALFEKGFFKRVKQKHDNRKDYRPTQARTEALVGTSSSTGFGRGDIKR